MAAGKHIVLLVDDEPEILFSLRGLLRKEFELHTAESGDSALEILAHHPIHVIMSDQRMPGMTGVELLRRARAVCPDAVRILFTGYADIKAVIDAINEGHVYRYLVKPWDPDDLLAVLREACERYEGGADRRELLADVRKHISQCQTLLQELPNGRAHQAREDAGDLLSRLDQALRPHNGSA
jgi:response regulator RpfG family c-di-GMP phosphodiesterase